MIAFLNGTVEVKKLSSLLVDVQGVGYEIICPSSVIESVQEKDSIFVYTHHHIREDDMSLFGFLKEHDLEFFRKLISVSGIGPKIALDIMEVSTDLVTTALEKGDVDFLKTLKGIGKKTAERMILELKGNLPSSLEDSISIPPEVVETLSGLGFGKSTIHNEFQKMKTPFPPAEKMVEWFLRRAGS